MKHLLIGVAAIALLTACGNDDGDDAVDTLENAGNAALDSADNALNDLANITLRAGNPANASAALTALSLDTSGAGRVSFAGSDTSGDEASFTNVSINIPGEDGDEDGAALTVSNLELDGLDMVDGQATFSKMSLSGIAVVPHDEDDAEDGQMTIANIELVNPSPALAGWVASLMGNGEPADFPAPADISFDSWSMSDLDFDLDDGDDVVAFDIDSIQLGGVDGTEMGVASLRNITLNAREDDDAPVTFTLGSMNMTGADISWLEAVSDHSGDDHDGEELFGALMAKAYENPMDPGYDTIEVSDFAFDMDGVDFAMPSLEAYVERDNNDMPTRYVTRPTTMRLSADATGGEAGSELAGALGQVGYETVEMTFASDSRFDAASDRGTFAAEDNYLRLTDGFTLSFGGDFTGYSAYTSALSQMNFEDLEDRGGVNEQVMQNALSELVLNDFTLVLEDDSIVDRAFNLYAAQSGDDPAAARQQAVAMMSMAPMMAAGSGVDMELVTELTGAIASFLQEPGTLTISLNPEEPLAIGSLAEIEDPTTLTKSFLGLSVTHE